MEHQDTIRHRGVFANFKDAKDGNEAVLAITDNMAFRQIFINTDIEMDADSERVLQEQYEWVTDETEFELEIQVTGRFSKKWTLLSIGYVEGKAPLNANSAYEDAAHSAWLSKYG